MEWSAKGGHDDVEMKNASPIEKEAIVDVDQARSVPAAGSSGFRGFRQFPRIGWDALIHDGRRPEVPDTAGDGSGTVEFYQVYKRRWFGLAQLTLLNIIISWEVSLFLSCLVQSRLVLKNTINSHTDSFFLVSCRLL